ncbi:MAG: hypothetical protein LBC68_12830 [Prevotellaceae bacterium]|jgi:hypothetical protein|nr:hypothetical protein [Prevotellaceae bacterium]
MNTIEKIPFDKKYPKTWDVLTTIGAVIFIALIIIYCISASNWDFAVR